MIFTPQKSKIVLCLFLSAIQHPSRDDHKATGMIREGSVDVLDARCKTYKSKKVIHITENPIPDTIAC